VSVSESDSALTRSTVVTAVKFTISDHPQQVDELLQASIGEFLQTIRDSDLTVRRVALVSESVNRGNNVSR